MSFTYYTYDRKCDAPFAKELNEEVNRYFKKKNLSKCANPKMLAKSIFLIFLFFSPLILMLSGMVSQIAVMYLLWALMGVAMAGIGMCIMHDAIHGAYSRSKSVNKLLGLTLNMVGGNAFVWHVQHNVLHHTYPNVDQVDDDLDIPFILRMSPHQPRYWFHRYQQLYVWILYAFATLFWVTSKDFVMLNKYRERQLLDVDKHFFRHVINIVVWKIIYFGYLLVLPMVLLSIPFWHVLLMFLVMHLTAGVLLSIIFQPAHVFEGTDFIKQDKEVSIDRSWHLYQLQTTTNFKLGPFMSWLSGGLNYQIEHHLFPNICHVHYPKLSKIVKKLARKYDMPYHLQGSLAGALKLHYEQLRILGAA